MQEELEFYKGLWIRKRFHADKCVVDQVFVGDEYRTDLIPVSLGPELIIDIGAHIGAFASRWKKRNPQATVRCVEVCPENFEVLCKNHLRDHNSFLAACSYIQDSLVLFNTVIKGHDNTGGSEVFPAFYAATHHSRHTKEGGYALDTRPIEKVTLEDLAGGSVIDVLKLDCEGSEYDILSNTTVLPRTRWVIGEGHGAKRWREFAPKVFKDWDYRELRADPQMGELLSTVTFHARNPKMTAPLPIQRKPDISEYYTPERAFDEEVAWVTSGLYHKHLDVIRPRIEQYHVKSVIEFGCGSGLLASKLPDCIDVYTGIENNDSFIQMARNRNKDGRFMFVKEDARKLSPDDDNKYDLSVACSFLKHFGLHEWNDIAKLVMRLGDYCYFNLMVADNDHDDGADFHHVYVTENRLRECMKQCGHIEESRTLLYEGEIPGVGKFKDLALWTMCKE